MKRTTARQRSNTANKAIATMKQEYGKGCFRTMGLKAARTRKRNGN